jgi:D-alanyl-D-alanine carboxypeptidase (penicillin-binding protein 5/6)
MKLLDYGFATCENAVLAKKGEVLGTIVIEKGSPSSVNAIADSDINLLVKKGEGDQVTTEIVLFERIKAPLKAGDKVGELIALKDSAEVGRYPLVADGDVEVAKLHEIYIRMLKTLI